MPSERAQPSRALWEYFVQGNFEAFWIRQGLILDYHRFTVQPGEAMTVKEMGPAFPRERRPFLRLAIIRSEARD